MQLSRVGWSSSNQNGEGLMMMMIMRGGRQHLLGRRFVHGWLLLAAGQCRRACPRACGGPCWLGLCAWYGVGSVWIRA